MSRSLVIALLCGMSAVALAVEYTGTISTGKLRAMDSPHKVKDEFIAVLNANHRTWKTTMADFVEFLTAHHPHVHILDEYYIRDFVGVRLHIPDWDVQDVSRSKDVRFMQANLEVTTYQNNVSCKAEKTTSRLWGLSRVSDRDVPDYETAQYVYLSDDGEAVDAYVIDTGVHVTHEEFEGRASHGFTASSIKASGESDDDLNGHGTHVAGTIAGKTYGAAKKANIIGVKVLNGAGRGTTADVVEGVEYVHQEFRKKADKNGKKPKVVVNMSLGGGPFGIGGADEAAISMAVQEGITFVVAAGNDAFDACFVSPARLSQAITVGASNIEDAITYFTNHGPCVDVFAPGQDILSAYIGSDTSSRRLSGTSMASPLVAGVVARYLSQVADAPTPASVKAWVQNTATSGVLEVEGYDNMPNSLLYMACEADSPAPQLSGLLAHHSYGGSELAGLRLTDEEAWIYVSASIAMIVILCCMGFIVQCCILNKAKSILTNIYILQRMGFNDVRDVTFHRPEATHCGENTKLLP